MIYINHFVISGIFNVAIHAGAEPSPESFQMGGFTFFQGGLTF